MSNDETGYNGWTNRETWLVSLWLDNDHGTYTAVRELADAHKRTAEGDADHNSAVWLADDIRDYVDELPEVIAVTDGPASFVVDILGAALANVDWEEIANTVLSE